RIARMGVADRSPPQHRHANLRGVQVAAEIGDRIRQLVRTLSGGGIDAVLDHPLEERSFQDRLADTRARPRRDLAVAQTAAEAMDEQRAVVTATDIVLAG